MVRLDLQPQQLWQGGPGPGTVRQGWGVGGGLGATLPWKGPSCLQAALAVSPATATFPKFIITLAVEADPFQERIWGSE